MKRSFKILLLGLTVLPAVSLLLFWPLMLWTSTGPDREGLFGTVYLAWAGGAAYYFSIGLTAFYLFHASKRADLKDQMLAWAILFLFFGMLTQPVYWYMYIWRERAPMR